MAESPPVTLAMRDGRAHTDADQFAKAVKAFEAGVRQIEHRYGENSVEAVQAYTVAYVALASGARSAAAEPFARRAVERARRVLGEFHRETATLIGDHAATQYRQRRDQTWAPALPAMRQVVTIRTRVLGDALPETAAGRFELAEQLLRVWRHRASPDPTDALLTEAMTNATLSLRTFAEKPDMASRVPELYMLMGRIALAQRDPARAEREARRILAEWGDAPQWTGGMASLDGERLLRDALVAQGRTETQIRETLRTVPKADSPRTLATLGQAIKALASPKDATPPATSGCSESTAPIADQSLAWVKTNQVLWVLDDRGRLFRGGFDDREFRQVSDHAFQFGPESYLSPDGRWLLYGGTLADGQTEGYWWFDLQSGTERRLITAIPNSVGLPAFSADGRYLAYFVRYRSERADAKLADVGIWVVDLRSGQASHLALPRQSRIPPEKVYGSVDWRADRPQLLVRMVGYRGEEHIREAYQVSVTGGDYRPIRQRRPSSSAEDAPYFDSRGDIIAVESRRLMSERWFTETYAAPDGALSARINDLHELRIGPAGQETRLVDVGRYEDCAGLTIGIHGWVEGHRYLIYHRDFVPYIVDTTTLRKARLLGSFKDLAAWTW